MSSSESLSDTREEQINNIITKRGTSDYDFNDSILSKYKRKSYEILDSQRKFSIADPRLEKEALQQYQELNKKLCQYSIDNPTRPPKSQTIKLNTAEQANNLNTFNKYRDQPSDDRKEGVYKHFPKVNFPLFLTN